MLRKIYRKMLCKLALNDKQLGQLLLQLKGNNICAGPFIKGKKMCPNTTALSIKLGRGNFLDGTEVYA